MAPIKRKKDVGATDIRPSKKQRSSPPAVALPKEEPAFPRGGASVLTPLEQKQIQIQARQDVLFEQNTGKQSHREEFDDENDGDLPAQSETGAAKPKKRSKAKHKGVNGSAPTQEKTLRIEGLSYKRLVPGSLVLGQVAQINRHDIALSLPNNLTGYISLTSISESLTARIEDLAEGHEDDEADSISDKPLDLQSMFSIGQYLRASVLSTERGGDAGINSKRHISLSIEPRYANQGLSGKDLAVNSTVQASVASVEDHGLVMDLGLDDGGMRGFLSSKELSEGKKLADIREGAVYLCLVSGQSSNGKTIKLSMDSIRLGNVKKGAFVTNAPTVDAFLPGTAVEFLVLDALPTGVVGKIMGIVDVTADLIHSGAASRVKDLERKYPVGSKARGRIICTFPSSEERKLGISLEHHIVQWKAKTSGDDSIHPTKLAPLSAIIDEAKVVKVVPGIGLFMDIGIADVRGFAHISKLSDGKIEALAEDTGSFKLGTIHPARIIGYNSMDGVFILSLEPKVISQPFLRLEDVKAGQLVKATIDKTLIGAEGVTGLIVTLADGVSGLVPENHFADVRLQHPERKFKEGSDVSARILSVDLWKRQIRLTLKKSLVNTDVKPWIDYAGLLENMQSPGTIINVLPNGAVVQFYGSVRAFLPVSEMSESFIQDPREHFRVGQVVNVRIVSVDAKEKRMTVSCKDPSIFGTAQQEAFTQIEVGQMVEGLVSGKTQTDLTLELQQSKLKAKLLVDHLADGSETKATSLAKQIRIGQTLRKLVVLRKDDEKHLIHLSSKPSLVKATSAGELLTSFDDVQKGAGVVGYVNNITATGVFVQFAGDVSALLLKQHLLDDTAVLPEYGLRRHQSIAATVLSIDHGERKFLLTQEPIPTEPKNGHNVDSSLPNPVDDSLTCWEDLQVGKITKAKIISIKATQLNVQLADGVQGRVDASSAFDSWEGIADPQQPLSKFKSNDVIPVRVLGIHDSRNHRFLPITHRSKQPVFELTAKQSDLDADELDILTLDKIDVGSKWTVFVNNVEPNCLWVNLSPNVRSRIRAIDAANDTSATTDLAKNFPIGSALKVKVSRVDLDNSRIDLTARDTLPRPSHSLENLSKGQVLAGRITKVTDRQIMVQLGENASGAIHLVDMADSYAEANPWRFKKNQTIQVCIKDIDRPNKRLLLSCRPSQVLSSSLPVEDPDLQSASQIKVNDIRRGFITHVADSGIFIALSSQVTAFVRIADLTDLFIKDWKASFEIDQLVKGKVLMVDPDSGHVHMSLKQSHLDQDYKPPLLFNDVKVGQVVTGKVRKVAEFGVFVVFDDSANVSGLCHKSAMSDNKNVNPKKLYDEGDLVQAKILSINREKRQISLGLKASYFADGTDDDMDDTVVVGAQDEVDAEVNYDSDDDVEDDDSGNGTLGMEGVMLDSHDDDMETDEPSDGDVDSDVNMKADNAGVDFRNEITEDRPSSSKEFKGLSAGGFDWTGDSVFGTQGAQSESEGEAVQRKKRKNKLPEAKVDRTGDLDVNGPQSGADFERLLLGQPNSSALWLGYMAFQLQLGETDKAREIAERALKTIYIREEGEKLNCWIALLNLENTYGTDEALEKVLKRACQYNDPQDIHERLISIHIQAGQNQKADDLFQATLKRFTQSPDLYLNYATFLMTTLDEADRARALLPRAMQALPSYAHLNLTSKFAQLEFKSPNGEAERGRTIFETLVTQWPRRLDLWNVLLDLEMKQGETERARKLFERVTGSGMKLKPRKAKFFYKRWLEFEQKNGDEKNQGRVKRLAAEYVKAHGKTAD